MQVIEIVDPTMIENRQSLRHRVLKAGTIAFGSGAGISCTVRNMSESGASLEVDSPIGIPEVFKLVIEKDHFERACRVVWRSKNRIGIAFN